MMSDSIFINDIYIDNIFADSTCIKNSVKANALDHVI